MKILIIGSEGFIGSHLVQHCLALGWQVHGCDLTEYSAAGYVYTKLSVLSPDLDTLFGHEKFDVVVNAAGSGNVGFSVQQPHSDFEANSLSVARILDALRKQAPQTRFVQLSSAAVYGNPARLPVQETDALQPLSPYGYHKWISEALCREYHQIYGIPVVVLRPFSVYGEGLKKQLLWDICNRLQSGQPLTLFGTGRESRDFIHIHDLVKGVQRVIEQSRFEMDIYNVAAGAAVTVAQVANALMRHYGATGQAAFNGELKPGDPLYWQADISRLQQMGFVPEVPLETGIAGYVQWFRSLPRPAAR